MVASKKIVSKGKSVDNEKKQGAKQKKEILRSELVEAVFKSYSDKGTEEDKKNAKMIISSYLKQEADRSPVFNKYNLLVLYDPTSLIKTDADKIYNAVTAFTEKKPLLLILHSGGGDAGSAYLIGKLCREYCNDSFIICVPRYAKSAATLICCAANEIHMGSLSELGPIDPQIDNLPALGLKYSIEHIAELVKKYPESSDMFARFLSRSLKLINLGYYERVAESAGQYAEKLLLTHKESLPKEAGIIAKDLVFNYKDHGFVIDKTEAEEIFGGKIIKKNTQEYFLSNYLYKALSFVTYLLKANNYSYYLIGSLDSDLTIVHTP